MQRYKAPAFKNISTNVLNNYHHAIDTCWQEFNLDPMVHKHTPCVYDDWQIDQVSGL